MMILCCCFVVFVFVIVVVVYMTAMTINFSSRWICVEYYLLRVQGIAKLLDQLDLIGRTSELARLFGIQFLEVLSRGSQVRKFHITYCHRLAHVGVHM
jgi:hypothetical protein